MFKTNLINKKVDAIVHDLLENKTVVVPQIDGIQ
jgi:hypothetical protein